MINSTAPQIFSAATMRIGGRQADSKDTTGPSPTKNTGYGKATATSAASNKTSLYDNFHKEISQRLSEALKKNGNGEEESPDPAVLAQSLTGAIGQIEQLFGREAATEAMAKILTGTAEDIGQNSLLNSIQSALGSLGRQDPLGSKTKQLTQAFNQGLELERQEAEEKIEAGETLGLSYALARHFGSTDTVEIKKPQAGSAVEADAPNKQSTAELIKGLGFDESGRWGQIEVVKEDQAAAEEMKEAAEAAINQLTGLTLATVIDKGNGGYVFEGLSNFLADKMGDKETAAFIDDCLFKAYEAVSNKYGKAPKMTEMLSQVYSKVAADGDADQLVLLENYINGAFKDNLNQVLADLQQAEVLGGSEIGQLQFKGLGGVSLAGESGSFSLNWGFKDDATYDRTISKQFLQEDIRGVKAVKEKKDEFEAKKKYELRAETPAGQIARNARETGNGDRVSNFTNNNEAEWEKFAETRRQSKLEEALTIKFGQLDEGIRQQLEQYLKDSFSEELSEKLLGQVRWNKDLMSGLAAIQSEIQRTGTDGYQADNFMKFINGQLKEEVGKITEELGGLEFEGWQASQGSVEASFRFTGQNLATKVNILEPIGPTEENEEGLPEQPIIQQGRTAEDDFMDRLGYPPKYKQSGFLINFKA